MLAYIRARHGDGLLISQLHRSIGTLVAAEGLLDLGADMRVAKRSLRLELPRVACSVEEMTNGQPQPGSLPDAAMDLYTSECDG